MTPEDLAKQLGLSGRQQASGDTDETTADSSTADAAQEGEQPESDSQPDESKSEEPSPETSTGKKASGKGRNAESRIKELNRRAKDAEGENQDLRQMVTALAEKIDALNKPKHQELLAEVLAGDQETKLTPEARLRMAATVAENEILRTYPGLPDDVLETAIERRVAFQAKGLPFSLKEVVASAMAAHDYEPDRQTKDADEAESQTMTNQNQNGGKSLPRQRSVSTGPSGRATGSIDTEAAQKKQRETEFATLLELRRSRPTMHREDRRKINVEYLRRLGF